MAKIKLLNLKGEAVKDITLNDAVWNIEVNEPVLFDAITFAQAGMRQGTAKTKQEQKLAEADVNLINKKEQDVLVKDLLEAHNGLVEELYLDQHQDLMKRK